MSAPAILAGTATSLAALAHLAATDPKRRRAFGLEQPAEGRPRLAWTAALLPGVLVPLWAGAAGFFIWFGAVAVLGWAVAATSPTRMAAVRRLATARVRSVRDWVEPLFREAGRRIREIRLVGAPNVTLEARVRRLEAEVALLEARLAALQPAGADVVELPRGGDAVRTARSRSS
jgi:hypothetical protein